MFYQLTGRLPHKGLEFKEENFIVHFYDTFAAASIKLLGKAVRSCRTTAGSRIYFLFWTEPLSYIMRLPVA